VERYAVQYRGGETVTEGAREPLVLTVPEAAAELKVSESQMYRLLGAGKIRSVKEGRTTRIPYSEITAYLERKLAEQDPRDAA
jgi:excisionase family DNA binding protein